MYIARILFPVKVLGPGNRIGIWFDGCEHQCKGCSNPELWEFNDRYNISVGDAINLIQKIVFQYEVDGFTITGGDPFYQPNDLLELLNEIQNISEDVLVYSGYDYSFLKENFEDICKKIAVLIDGKYIEERNNGSPLRGSDNQEIHILKESMRERYESYLSEYTNQIQNFSSADGVISVGIHRPGYNSEIKKILEGKVVCVDE